MPCIVPFKDREEEEIVILKEDCLHSLSTYKGLALINKEEDNRAKEDG